MSTSTITMEQFFSRCGELFYSQILVIGSAPQRKFVSSFLYSTGYAEYDGRSWTFKIFTGAEE